jgi:hypothetical protein
MGKLLAVLKQEFNNAPIWQKLMLIGLAAFIFYYFAVRPSLSASRKILVELDSHRDNVFRELQSARYLLEDARVISENYKLVRDEIAENIYYLRGFEKFIRTVFVQNSREIYIIDFPEAIQTDFGGITQVKVQVKLRISPEQLVKIIGRLSEIKYTSITYLEYKNNILLLEADFLVNQGYIVFRPRLAAKPLLKTAVKSQQPEPIRINGFLTLDGVNKVLLNSKLFNIGDKYQGYTIISIDTERKQVILQKGRKRLVLSKYFRKG